MGRLSIAQGILRKSTGILRRIVAPIDGVGGVTLSQVCPHCHPRLRTTSGESLLEQCTWWCAACGGQCGWRAPKKGLGHARRHGPEATVFRAHGAPQGTCDNLINALKVLANKQKDGDGPEGNKCCRLVGEQSQQ